MRFAHLVPAVAALWSAVSGSPVHKRIVPKLAQRGQTNPINGTGGGGANPPSIVVQPGQTLSDLAKQFGTGICDIANANQLADPNVILAGQTLAIPPPTATPDNQSCLKNVAPPATATCVAGGPDRLVVPADGLSVQLAAKFLGITEDSFLAANGGGGGGASGELAGNSMVQVPVCPNSQCTIGPSTIKEGDVFDAVAAKAGSTTGQILALNPGIDRLKLQIGQTFTLPSNCQNATGNAAAGAP